MRRHNLQSFVTINRYQLIYCILIALTSIYGSYGADEKKKGAPQPPPTDPAGIVRSYFAQQRIYLDEDLPKEFADRYKKNVVDKMAEYISGNLKADQLYYLSEEINTLIFKNVEEETMNRKSVGGLSPREQATLDAMDLIVPNSSSQPVIELAKADLRAFCVEDGERASELIGRLGSELHDVQLHTREALEMLEGFYQNWIPLARLSNYIEKFGTETEGNK